MAASTAARTSKAPLDLLQDMVNAVLIETGTIFSDSAKHNSRSVVQTNVHLKESLPKYWATFHDALDALEEDLMHARAVFRRELRTLQAAKDKPLSDAVSEPRTGEDAVMENGQQPVTDQLATSASSHAEQDIGKDFDIIMSEEAEEASKMASDQPGTAATLSDVKFNEERGQPVDSDTMLREGADGASMATDARHAVARPDNQDATSSKSNPASPTDDKDLDSIFEEAQGENEASGGENKINTENSADLDATGTQAPPAGGALNSAADKPENDVVEPAFTSTDVSSLLPGLESYANDNGDGDGFGTIGDFGDFTNTPFDGNSAMQGMDSTEMADDFMSAQGANTNFDELFNYGDFNNEGGTETQGFLDGTEFDENFFNLDNAGS